jgi:hypothetical protein
VKITAIEDAKSYHALGLACGGGRNGFKSHFKDEMEMMKNQLRSPFVGIDVFDGIRQETAPLRRAARANVEAGVEKKERVNQRLAALGRGTAKLNGKRETEVVRAHSENLRPGEKVRHMKMAIKRIEGSVQREIRKLKRNARKGERDLNDFEERLVSRMAV